ncbi:hypothetical protein [Saccharopolyspora elongata]|uniref:Uncharacterized protein n=1 Tax=Saccharopolyspora elongata TaxID=2530387 RepID=A0A4R4ZDQ3_9PSEU|nr:hypothetical protein [Saccharopolyspora elongata]TDD56598.1 hypothetical protein E1288_00460 [Saccharopolyspora elongata]
MGLGKDYFYDCLGPELFEINPRRRGVEITITEISQGGQKRSVMLTSTAFRRLIAEGYDILQEVDALRDEAMKLRGSALKKGNQ